MKIINLPPSQAVIDYFNSLQLGKAAAHCARCGRELTDPRSVQLRIGPECEKKEVEEYSED